MSAPFSDIRHGQPERLDEILENYEMDEQELRAALQNVLAMVIVLQRKVEFIETKELGML